MALYDANRIRKPKHFKLGPLFKGRSDRQSYVIGFDSEAERGKPFLFQFAHPDYTKRCDLIEIGTDKNAGLAAFFDYLYSFCTRKDMEYIVVGFNLQYEWTQIFHDIPDALKEAAEFQIELRIGPDDAIVPITIRAMNAKRFTLTAEMGNTKRRVRFIDAMAYFPMSLDKAASIIGAGNKLPKPAEFSRKASRTPEFIAYAKQDAILTQRLGDYIIALHKTYDVPTCMSAPHFAARTFRHKYLSVEIPLPSPVLEQIGLDSYHGGKNGFYLSKPMLLRNIWHYDIRSAYPEAMRQLPDIEQATWSVADEYQPGTHSLWRATVRVKPCKYGNVQCDSGHFLSIRNLRCPKSCRARNARSDDGSGSGAALGNLVFRISATGYEIDSAMSMGEIEILDAEGWIMRGPSGGPLTQYVDDFYRMKRYTKDSTERTAAKLFLNSLYGKFFQKVPLGSVTAYDIDTAEMIHTDPSQDHDYEAGGLYHPPIASLITGYVRAKIHRLEHKYDSVMTSTDGFFAYNPPDETELGDALGQLEAEIGNLRIWRERLYVFSANATKKQTYALHGFRGTLVQLMRMPLKPGITFDYLAQAMVTLKMSTRRFGGQKFGPGEFVELPFDVKLAKAAQGP